MRKVTYIISDVHKALTFEWIADEINKDRFLLSFILLNPGPCELESHLHSKGFNVNRVTCRGKRDWLKAIAQTTKLLRCIKPDTIHCHLIQANVIGLIAGRLAGVKNLVYTRHHSSLHHIYFPKGVWIDKLTNHLATHIIAISGLVRDILIKWEKADPDKIRLVHHGFKLEEFSFIDPQRIGAFKERNNIEEATPVIGVISRFTEYKGIQYIIPAFVQVKKQYPNAILMLLNAHGDYEKIIQSQLKTLSPSSLRLIKFENDIAAAYKSMSIFLHVPIDEHSEAFGQTYVEALAAGIPSVFTLAGIAPDFVVDRYNALVVPFKNSSAIAEAIIELLDKPELQAQLRENGRRTVSENFDLPMMVQSLEALYEN